MNANYPDCGYFLLFLIRLLSTRSDRVVLANTNDEPKVWQHGRQELHSGIAKSLDGSQIR
jgi:hypothetical protein